MTFTFVKVKNVLKGKKKLLLPLSLKPLINMHDFPHDLKKNVQSFQACFECGSDFNIGQRSLFVLE